MEEWRKSTYSSAEGGSCVEVASARNWRKSRASTAQGGSCIEVASASTLVGVRDTKQAHLGQGRTVLSFSGQAWAEFLGRMPEIG